MSALDKYQCEGQMSIFDMFPQDMLFTKTSPELLVQTRERTSDVSLRKLRKLQMKTPLFLDLRGQSGVIQDSSWETDMTAFIRLLGEPTICNITDVHNADEDYVFLLTSTGTQPENYYLNCSEKPLIPKPSKLSQILEKNPDPKYNLSPKACQGILNRARRRGKKLPELLEKTLEMQCLSKNEQDAQGGGKGLLIQNERTGALATHPQSVCHEIVASFYPQMKAESQCYREDDISNTLVNGTNPGFHNGIVVKDEPTQQGMAYQAHGAYKESDVVSSCKERDYKDATDLIVFEPGSASRVGGHIYEDGKTGTIRANAGDNQQAIIQQSWDGTQIAPTLTAKNAGGEQRMPDKDNFNAVISYSIDSYNQTAQEEVQDTLRTNGGGDNSPKVCTTYGLDRASFNQGQNAQFDFSVEEEMSPTLVNRGPGGS